MKNNLNVLLFVFGLSFLVFSNMAFAFSPSNPATPSPIGGSSITNKNCGSTTAIQIGMQNNGGSQALCWYHTDKSSTWIKGTSSCISSGSGTANFIANIEMPSSGSDTRTLYVQCNDYGWPSSCSDSTQYNSPSQCGLFSTSCSSSASQSFTYTVSCNPPRFTIASDKPSLSLTCGGQSTTVSINMQSQDSNNLQCVYRVNNGQTINIDAPLIAGGAYSFSVPIGYPSPCTTQTVSYKVDVGCTDAISTLANIQSTTITASYTSDPCVAALANAQNSITDANAQITNAKNKTQEAGNLGADTTNAQASLNQASSQYSSAQTSLSTAQTTCNSGDKVNGPNQANSAGAYATQAKSYATDALNAAQNSITELSKKKTDATNKISDANSKVSVANIMIDKANSILTNTTSLSSSLPELTTGWDLITPKSNINTAKAKLDQSKNYIQEANTALNGKSYDLALSKAISAFQYSEEANSLATSAFNSLNEKVLGLGEVANALMSATSEVSQTDEILDKITYISRNVEKYGVSLSEAKSITSDSQSSTDSAKDLLSQAKNRYQAGMSSDAIQKALAARDAAAEPTNRLKRIVSSMKISMLDALEKAETDAKAKVSSAESAASDAAKTYGATSSEVIAAQQDVADAKAQMNNVTEHIKNVEASSELSTLVQEAGTAFQALEGTEAEITSANNHANSAKMGLITTAGSIGAVGAAAAGGGFLYWRRRKNKNLTSQNKTEHKKHENVEKIKDMEKPKHEEQKGKFCHKCGSDLEKHHKFCPKCGSKVK